MEEIRQIARMLLLGQHPAGERFEILLEIGLPYLANEEDDESNEWICILSMWPLIPQPHKVHGEGSLQSLCLAISLAHRLISGFIEDGGKLCYSTGEEVGLNDLNVLFGK